MRTSDRPTPVFGGDEEPTRPDVPHPPYLSSRPDGEPLHGLDLSHYQDPKKLDWRAIAENVDFVIVRAAYGTTPDKKALEHVLRARSMGLRVTLYTFFRPSQSFTDQLTLFDQVARLAKIGPGDIVPAIDIEEDPLPHRTPPAPSWNGPCEALASALRHLYGGCLVYLTQDDWGDLGKPAWVLEHHLWVPHWRLKGPRWPPVVPATPGGRPAAIHQYGVGPGFAREGVQDAFAPGALDHNISRALPLIPAEPYVTVPPRIEIEETAASLAGEIMRMDRDEFRAARNRAVARMEE